MQKNISVIPRERKNLMKEFSKSNLPKRSFTKLEEKVSVSLSLLGRRLDCTVCCTNVLIVSLVKMLSGDRNLTKVIYTTLNPKKKVIFR